MSRGRWSPRPGRSPCRWSTSPACRTASGRPPGRSPGEVGRPFDLAHGPLLRLHLLRLGGRDHILIANVHHIASDGWSTGILVRESTALYQAFAQGLPSPLPELPIQYIDFALWQREWLTGPVLDAQLGHWRQELAGAPALLELPTDRPRPAVQSTRGGAVHLDLPAVSPRRSTRSRARRVPPPFIVLLAAFQTLLHRWSGSDDVLVGSPVANRNRTEIEGLIGFFVNTLVHRLRLREDDDFAAILQRVRATTLAGHDHQDLPFELLIDELGGQRSLAHNPLFQVLLVLQNAPPGELRVPGLTFTQVEVAGTTSKFDLGLEILETDAGIGCVVEYAADLFDGTTMLRLLAQLGTLLAAVADDPGQRIAGLPLLAAPELHQVACEWNDTPGRNDAPGPPEEGAPFASVPALLAARAAAAPDAVAVAGAGRELTYAELDRRSDGWRAACARSAWAPRSASGSWPSARPSWPWRLLGVLKAGRRVRAPRPVPPRGAARLRARRRSPPPGRAGGGGDAGAARRSCRGLTIVSTEDGEETGAALPAPKMGEPDAGSLAYVLYTSGSAGRPKGVLVEHRHRGATLARPRRASASRRTSASSPSHAFDFDIGLELLGSAAGRRHGLLVPPAG